MIQIFGQSVSVMTIACTTFNILFVLPLLVWTAIRQRRFRKVLDFHLNAVLQSEELLMRFVPPRKVYLVWLIDKQNSPTMALIGCCRTEQKAIERADGREHHIQEIEVL